jgi:excinuclease ABC subunit A
MEETRDGDLDINQVGREIKMPWETDGRGWHTRDRVDRKGGPCRWDGRILAKVVDRIHELGEFSETDWNSRSVVEIAATKKSVGWFFHAITAETWLLKMKFRVYRGTFQRQALLDKIRLKTLNQMDALPIYGNEPRVKCRSARGPWQEVEIRAHSLEEVDTPEFWSFLEDATQGFFNFTQRAETKLEDHMPWKKLGQKWHFLRKGFPPGKPARWGFDVLGELCEMIRDAAPEAQFLWNNQIVVRIYPPEQRDPWASIYTKRPEAIGLTLVGPKNAIALGRLSRLGSQPELDGSKPDYDVIKLSFRNHEDLHRDDLATFLKEHLAIRLHS